MLALKKFRDSLLPTLATFALVGCGDTSVSLEEKLVVAMLGVFEAPEDASGNADPRYLSIDFLDLTLTKSDGEEVDAFEPSSSTLRIVNRSQIIAEYSLSKYVGESFTSVKATFAPAATAGGKYASSLPVTLSTPAPVYTEVLTVEKTKNIRLDLKAQWKNTLTRDDDANSETATSPTFRFVLANE